MCISVLVYLCICRLKYYHMKARKNNGRQSTLKIAWRQQKKRLYHSSIGLSISTHNDNNNNRRIITERLEMRSILHVSVYVRVCILWKRVNSEQLVGRGLGWNRRKGELKSKIGQAHALDVCRLYRCRRCRLVPLCYHVKTTTTTTIIASSTKKKGDIITLGFACYIFFLFRW